MTDITTTTERRAATSVPLHPHLAARWSTRSFDGEHELSDDELLALLEAARWAPSSFNSQPWRFVVTRRGERSFDALLGTLTEKNRSWAHRASALLLVLTEPTDSEGRSRPHAVYDTGASIAHLTHEATDRDLSIHQMAGFDAEAARRAVPFPDTLDPVVVVAVGAYEPGTELPEPLAAKESAPRRRHPLSELILTEHSTDLELPEAER